MEQSRVAGLLRLLLKLVILLSLSDITQTLLLHQPTVKFGRLMGLFSSTRPLSYDNAQSNKLTNYQDGDTDCISEGGSWNFSLATYDAEASLLVDRGVEVSNGREPDDDIHWKEIAELLFESIPATVAGLVDVCDRLDALPTVVGAASSVNKGYFIQEVILRYKRSLILESMLRANRTEYLAVGSFMVNRIPRDEYPNLQGISLPTRSDDRSTQSAVSSEMNGDESLVDDCELSPQAYSESLLDRSLLFVFRRLVQREIGFRSNKPGIQGLLEEGRHYKLSEEGRADDSANQHRFVRRVLSSLLTPVLPPFYRIFMSGIVPSAANGDPEWLVSGVQQLVSMLPDFLPFKKDLVPGKQLGPLIYAPFLTSVVTPPLLSFLVGPSRINLRKDGQLGGMVVEKCKFLQVTDIRESSQSMPVP